ncbi:hypothetical protein [Xenorhabdus sp. PB30.3]|uniref:hypothetical protein n=1 Tax=Xenorhabdus sp. PB30.3 TaxID=2788941 RepID=UPI001E2FE9A2|nr:hypothetical protein [Xenorhabdus sp. PB30.3]MCC8381932.1 hypothetical protein [Xenorhabdus sp. PB30.3]
MNIGHRSGYRSDYSDYLYHWIKTTTRFTDKNKAFDIAFETMKSIIDSGFICSGAYLDNKSKNKCISFTESVLDEINVDKSLYQPFGFQFKKSRVFDLGGRHAIYSPSHEKNELGTHQWRFVKFDLNDKTNWHDFSWEREWRLNEESISILEHCTGIYVPNEYYQQKAIELLSDITLCNAYSNSVFYDWWGLSQEVSDFCGEIEKKIKITKIT